jgi:hypothetical protein
LKKKGPDAIRAIPTGQKGSKGVSQQFLTESP